MGNKYLSDEERKCSHFIFAVIDATIAEYGKAILDCGHETDGKCICLDKDEQGRYWAMCKDCFNKIPRTKEDKKIVDTKRTFTSQYVNKGGKC
jgi:hypothetical protein